MVRIANPNVQTLDKVRSLHNKSRRMWVGILDPSASPNRKMDEEGFRCSATREALTASPKSMPISGAKNEPSGQTEKSPNVETLPLYIAKFWSVQTCNFFSVGSRTCIVSYSHFRKLHDCTLIFLYLFFGNKRREIDHIVSEVLCLRPYAPQFLKYGHVPCSPSTQWFCKVR